eukprot:2529719-Alexandrium_andersonii.AAC.1
MWETRKLNVQAWWDRCASNGRAWQAQLSQGVDEAWTCRCRDVEAALIQAGIVSPEGSERSRGTRGT